MSGARTRPGTPETSELVEGLTFYPIALVVSATVAPGLTLCIPGLLFATVLILIPLVAMAVVVLLAAAVVAAPVVLVRAVRKHAGRRAAAKPRVAAGVAPAVYFGRPSLASVGAHMALPEVRTEALSPA
jgi:hypothetical protein